MERRNHNRQNKLVQSVVSAGPNEWSYLLAVLGFALMNTCGLAAILFYWWLSPRLGILTSAPSLQAFASVGNRLMLSHSMVILCALGIVSTLGAVSSVVALTAASHTRPTARLGAFLGSVTLILFFIPENLQHISLIRTELSVINLSMGLLWATGFFAIVLQTAEQQADDR